MDVNEGLVEAISMARQSLLSDQVEFRESLGPVPAIAAKPDEIRQAFFNIIRNAVQAMEGKGTVDIESRLEDDRVAIHVHDTGPGISLEHQRKIFDPFFTTKDPDEGEGLGLFIVQQIVKKYDGEIALESREGAGTTFTIRFPVGNRTGGQ